MGSQIAKKAAALAAAPLIKNGMKVGLGTGSTVSYLIEELGKRCDAGLSIIAAASSSKTKEQAEACGIPLADPSSIPLLDITIDGADEIDPQFRLIKGGGGALLREKIVASNSRTLIIIADETKWVKKLGAFPLSLEVTPFGLPWTLRKLKEKGYHPTLRGEPPFVTDNQNYIVDLHFKNLIEDPEKEDLILRSIPGIVETGFFFDLAKMVITGYADGNFDIKEITI